MTAATNNYGKTPVRNSRHLPIRNNPEGACAAWDNNIMVCRTSCPSDHPLRRKRTTQVRDVLLVDLTHPDGRGAM